MRVQVIIRFVVITLCINSCTNKKTLFELLPSSKTGIEFANKVQENDSVNVLEYMNIYTGAGVAAGDINNDGLVDLYFSGNQKTGKLYLNKGNFEFEDITVKAGLFTDRWCAGVSFVDINHDGLLDLYICVAGSTKFGSTANLLYINNGNLTFSEKAHDYGLDETRLTMNASFFDYDLDGDLDVFLITNPADERVSFVNVISETSDNEPVPGVDILYRNNGNGTFTDVSEAAGIIKGGYSLSAAISDVNNDGLPDIYVANDFLTSDILYINNGNGTFTDKIRACLKHSSFASMGCDVADFNNDGRPDIYTVDMLPEDNFRRKMIIPAASYDKFQLLLQRGYEAQYTRNTLQLNNGNGTFSDIAFAAGVSNTDWSWAALFGDYDNDGDKDLVVTNGFYRDLGNLDYITYQARLKNPMGTQTAKREVKLKAIKELKTIPLENYLFENNDNLSFTKRTEDWGFTQKGFSNGACYADLDNDGAPELIINCFNDKARIYKNNALSLLKNNFLKIKFSGPEQNTSGIGAKLWLYAGGKMQYQEFYPSRGFESSMEPLLFFGLGKNTKADSIVVKWPDGKEAKLQNISANKTIELKYNDAIAILKPDSSSLQKEKLFTDITGKQGLNYLHQESDFVDFKIQQLLPHMLSKEGPGIAVGDVDGDGKTDFYIGGAAGYNGSFFLQKSNSVFVEKKFDQQTQNEDMGVLLFDADNDHDLDLYIVSGGTENDEGSPAQQDRLYYNDGKGNFSLQKDALPNTSASGSCVVACDYDKDGDLDLFVGGRTVPGSYPLPAQSYLLRNDNGKFTDLSQQQLPRQGKMGMVTSALWTDYDNDGWIDLMLAGEFMPITFIKNNKGKLDFNSIIVVPHSSGWWNSITAGDFDQDGDMDYIVGNLGLNSRHKASVKEPLCIYAKDYDKNGRIDPIMCYYVHGQNYIYPTRDELIKQVNAMRGRFKSYEDYASVSFDESFTKEELSDAIVVKSECFETSYFENKGNGQFERKGLPIECQFAPVYGVLTGDYNNDGFLDVLLTGNSYATETSTGRYDAMTGILLAGNGKGNFSVLQSNNTGFKADADAKGTAEIYLQDGKRLILVANNAAALQSYTALVKPAHMVTFQKNDAWYIVHKKDGSSYKAEIYHGNSYLSASAAVAGFADNIEKIIIFSYDNSQREIKFK